MTERGPEGHAPRSGARTWAGLDQVPVEELAGVGERRGKALEALGIRSVTDLLTHYPRRYLDRTRQASLAELAVGEEATVLATVRKVGSRRTRNRRSLVEVDCFDGTGYLRATFFNQPWRSRQLAAGTEAVFFGKLETYQGRRRMTNPVVDLVGDRTGRIVPVYPSSEKAGVSTWELAGLVEEALRRAGDLVDPLPESWRGRLRLPSRTDALRAVHAPTSLEEAEEGRRRLALDELLRLQVALVGRKRAVERDTAGVSHLVDDAPEGLLGRFRATLPFALTGAQRRAVDAIRDDMARPVPMHRLLQGDVGAGKTLVALSAMLVAVQGGHQAALMAPTEVLAEQHHMGLTALLAQLEVPDPSRLGGVRPLRTALLSGRTAASERARLLADMAGGQVDIVVGTHALLTEDVRFASLGLVVVDELHRFGVEQRSLLRSKGPAEGGGVPDVLVMTATPIPRTAAMTVYGDLDVTVLDEMPPGRTPIATAWAHAPDDVAAAWRRVRDEVAAGRRAFVVCPLVEESDRIEARSATEERERLSAGELAGLRLGLLHGQVSPREKESVMTAFRAGELDVLVATTVVEVGVDVPEATVMVVEDADRFGMAQLHQLRGRVGRGVWPAWCYLLSPAYPTPEAQERLEALESSTDGFFLAEVDLSLRGEGTVLGVRQQGRSDLKLASLARDLDLVVQAREIAFDIVDNDPTLERSPVLAQEIGVFVGDEAEFLLKS